MLKLESNAAPFTACPDRFNSKGYREALPYEERLQKLASVKGLDGVTLGWPCRDLTWFKLWLKENGMNVGTVGTDTYDDIKWSNGYLMNRDAGVRREAIESLKGAMDLASEFPGSDVLMWLANDGYDYVFEDDYSKRWDWLMESLDEVAAYRSDVRVSLEYKKKEPRIRQYVSDYGKALFICEKLKRDNLGVVVDIGHSLLADESPAEAVAICMKYGKLFHVHLNDNYGYWDDDLIFGSVHFWEFLETFYVLKEMNYDGWYELDIWPYKGDGFDALQESVDRVRMIERLVDEIPCDVIAEARKENNTVKAMRVLREVCIKNY